MKLTDTLKEEIRLWVSSQRESLIRDLMDLVNIESVSKPGSSDGPFGSGCKKALAAMLEKGTALGFVGTCYEDACGSLSLDGIEVREPEKVTGIWCHLDVVPAGEGWQTSPFEAVYRDGLITGRGSQDNKSAAAMGLYLLKGLKELNIHLEHPAALYFGTSEECGMQDLDLFLARHKAPSWSLIADCGFPACYGEKGNLTVRLMTGRPTSFQVQNIHAGVAHNIIPGEASMDLVLNGETIHLESTGHAGHSAFPQGSANALKPLLEQFLALPQIHADDKNGLEPFVSLIASTDGSPAGISLEDAVLGDLTCCSTILSWEDGFWGLDLDIRYPHSANVEFLIKQLKGYAEAQGCRLQILGNLPSFGFSPDTPLIQKLTEVYNREMGLDTKPYAMAGGTYAAKLPNAIPFGISFPDKSAILDRFPKGHGDYHQPDESVIADQILTALSLYLMALIETDQLR